MDNELMRYASGEVAPRREERPVARRAKRIYREVQEKDMMTRGAFALSEDIVKSTGRLAETVKSVLADNPELGPLLGGEIVATFRQAQRIRDSLYDPWGF